MEMVWRAVTEEVWVLLLCLWPSVSLGFLRRASCSNKRWVSVDCFEWWHYDKTMTSRSHAVNDYLKTKTSRLHAANVYLKTITSLSRGVNYYLKTMTSRSHVVIDYQNNDVTFTWVNDYVKTMTSRQHWIRQDNNVIFAANDHLKTTLSCSFSQWLFRNDVSMPPCLFS